MARTAEQGARSARTGEVVEPRSRDAVAAAIGTALAVFLIARAGVTFVPSMALWGLNVQRFLGPWWAWAPWLAAALTLVPLVARGVLPVFETFGRTVSKAPWLAALMVGGLAGALVFGFPDRLYFVGDFLIRLGGLREGEDPTVLSPQAFPLDVWLHYTLPRRMEAWSWSDVHTAARWIGAAGAALLGGASVALARSLRLGSAATAAATAAILFGGYLCLYTGESKAFAEACVVVVAFSACAFAAIDIDDDRAKTSGRRASGVGALLGAGLCLAIGFWIHRFALGLIPAGAATIALWWRAGRQEGRPLSRGAMTIAWVAAAIPTLALAGMGPRMWKTIVTYDLGANFATAEARAGGGMLQVAFAPGRLLDVLNLLLFLTPMFLVALIATLVDRNPGDDSAAVECRRRQAWLAASLAIPFALVFLAARPPQGLVRDWDSFATAGVALAVWSAWRVAIAIDHSRRAWLAVALIAVVVGASVQWLAHYANERRGLSRLEALMLEPPARPAVDRARTWDFLGWRHFRDQRYEESARAFEQAVTAAPSARNHTHWAMAETMKGRHDRALDIYLRATERDSNLTIAWFGVGVSGINSGDRAAVERAVLHLRRLAPDNDKTREIVGWLERQEPAPQ